MAAENKSSTCMSCHTVSEDCEDLDLKTSRHWLRIAVACVFAGQGMVFSLALNMTPPPFVSPAYLILHGGLIISALVVMGVLGPPLFVSTWEMLKARRISIEGLFTLSLLAAFLGSLAGSISGKGDVFYEVIAIVIAIYTFGRMLGERSHSNLNRECEVLKDRFNRAIVRSETGQWVEKHISNISVGELLRVDPGASFAADGVILEGSGYVEETALTGEPLPVIRQPGDKVRAGTWSLDSRFILEVEQTLGGRELDKILDALDSADGRPSIFQSKANVFVSYFLPLVLTISIGTALFWFLEGTWVDAILNSMAVLLVACPCALGLATPVAISHGLFRLAQMGLVSRDGALIDTLAKTRQVFFDKTGTLSEPSLQVVDTWAKEPLPIERIALISSIAQAQSSVKHPVARAISQYLGDNNISIEDQIKDLRLIPGSGIEFFLDYGGISKKVLVGDEDLYDTSESMHEVLNKLHEKRGKRIFVWYDEELVFCFVLRERLRKGVSEVCFELNGLDIDAQVLTGDSSPDIKLPEEIGLKVGLSSADKVQYVTDSRAGGKFPLFIGDGINDTAAMTAASGSIAMDSGVGLARSAAMAILSADRLTVIPEAIRLSRSIHKRLWGSLLFAALYNVVGVFLAAVGALTPVIAAIIMLISSFLVMSRAVSQNSYIKKR